MSFKAVTIINGEVHEGLHQSIEKPTNVSPVGGIAVQHSSNCEINMCTGQTKSLMKGQVTADDLRIDSGVLSTATKNGMPVRGVEDVTDNTLVTVQGVQMTAKMAAQLGLLSRDKDGSYSESFGKKPEGSLSNPAMSIESQAPFDEEPLNEEKGIEFSPALFDHEVEAALEQVAGDLGGTDALDKYALSALGGLVDNDISHSAKQLASAIGRELGETETFITVVGDRYRNMAANYITKNHKVDGDAVIQWISDNVPSADRASMAYEVFLGQTGVLDRMVEKFRVGNK